jgi:hypothetical protein
METFIKTIGWVLLVVVGGGAMLLGFQAFGVGPALLAVVPIWLLYAIKSGSTKRWKKGVSDTYREGQRIQQERDQPEP